ncbi:hypothetical protein LPB140_03375 [Sphingorhabdus lutea]|uniref:Uncharacterized protein n=1 Tax=Sphingorhabdus lutea TaxID=1913578 RepID=A0A1L3JA61_9SPHN|nr:type IV secretory system conjugative DNA transfer family protein [Sphingorhabdus lutea]APG62014.1 hypothetical protein LPB140_03375 [Sphingorhabdus lutea]
MRSLRTLILTFHGLMRLFWKVLPLFTTLTGYMLFATPIWLGSIFALVLGFAGVLAKYAAAQFERPVTLGGTKGNAATYNPLDFIRIHTPYEVDDARLGAAMLLVPEHSQANHWEREARTLITGLLLYIRHDWDILSQNLVTFRDFLMQDAEEFELLLAKMAASKQENVSRIARGFSQKEPKERSSLISTAKAV